MRLMRGCRRVSERSDRLERHFTQPFTESLVAESFRFAERRISFDRVADGLQATAFQRRVWEELRLIPCGSTRRIRDRQSHRKPMRCGGRGRMCRATVWRWSSLVNRVIREDRVWVISLGDRTEKELLAKEREASPE